MKKCTFATQIALTLPPIIISITTVHIYSCTHYHVCPVPNTTDPHWQTARPQRFLPLFFQLTVKLPKGTLHHPQKKTPQARPHNGQRPLARLPWANSCIFSR